MYAFEKKRIGLSFKKGQIDRHTLIKGGKKLTLIIKIIGTVLPWQVGGEAGKHVVNCPG